MSIEHNVSLQTTGYKACIFADPCKRGVNLTMLSSIYAKTNLFVL